MINIFLNAKVVTSNDLIASSCETPIYNSALKKMGSLENQDLEEKEQEKYEKKCFV